MPDARILSKKRIMGNIFRFSEAAFQKSEVGLQNFEAPFRRNEAASRFGHIVKRV
jgi:hypothetical protein